MTREEELKYIKKGKTMEKMENIILSIILILSYIIPSFIWVMR